MRAKKVVISVRDVKLDYNLSGLSWRRKKFTALKNISFDLHAGDSLGVVGRNGAGKSSLLRLLAGVIDPDAGEVVNMGVKPALMSLQAGFENQLSGFDNILLTGLLLGFDKAFIQERKAKIIQFSELGDFIHQPLKTYSAGMRARLGFSISYLLEPEVLLIDEVLGVGDVDFRKKSAAAMREKIKSEQTVVLVSHDAVTIKSLCNKALWVEDGEVKMYGGSAEVIDAYQSYALSHPRNNTLSR